MTTEVRLERPIFFIGVPRSGTTILFEAFARHKSLGWLSNYSKMWPAVPWVNILCPLLDNDIIKLEGKKKQHGRVNIANRFLPQPDEAYQFWKRYSEKPFLKEYMLGVEASEAGSRRLTRAVNQVVKWQMKERFATKLTGPGRITYLHSIFEDAIFVHVIRDGRAVVNSLLKVFFWRERGGLERPWWEDGLPQEYLDIWECSDRNSAVLAAIQWRRIIELAQEEAGQLGSGRYHEIRYEQFMADPHGTLSGLFSVCGLEDSQRVHGYINQGPTLRNMNTQYLTDMQSDDIRQMTAAMQPLLDRLGYV